MNTRKPDNTQPGSAVRPPTAEDVDAQIRDAQLRTRRHWYQDGLSELFVGMVFVAISLYFAAQAALAGAARQPGAFVTVLINLLLPVIVIAGALAGRYVTGRAKERLVYPRTGFVRFPQTRHVPKWLAGAIAGVISGLTVALVRRAPGVEAWLPAMQGFLLGVGAMWLARYSGTPRFTALGLVWALTGVIVSLFHSTSAIDGALVFGVVGLTMLASGAVVFRRFLREAPPPEES